MLSQGLEWRHGGDVLKESIELGHGGHGGVLVQDLVYARMCTPEQAGCRLLTGLSVCVCVRACKLLPEVLRHDLHLYKGWRAYDFNLRCLL